MRPAMKLTTILLAIAVLVVSFFISLKMMDWMSPRDTSSTPALLEPAPLPPAPRSSVILAQVTVALTAIRDAAESTAPRNFAGKVDNPASQILQNADITWAAARGPIMATGDQDVLTLATPLTGKLNVTGSLSSKAASAVGDVLSGLLGNNAAKKIGSVNIKSFNTNAEIKGNVTFTSRPKFAAAWHLEPNLAAQVTLDDNSLSVAGARVNVPAQIKPLIDKTVADQVTAAETRIRNDRLLEKNAMAQWARACRSIPLQGTGAGSTLPALWLELRPTRAIAAQPHVDTSAITLTLGIEAATRITSVQTKPDCPFPAKIAIVPPTPAGIKINVPIDIPFTDINKIMETQFVDRTFPEDGSGPVDVTVKRASIATSGDRLLISLLISAKEKKSFFGLSGQATVHIWGKPVLDQTRQILRLANIELAVESEAAFGLLGDAARIAIPHLQKALADKTTIDLKPLAANTQQKIAAAIAEFQGSKDGVRVTAETTSLRLADIVFDSKTLRVIAEVEGGINVLVTALPGL